MKVNKQGLCKHDEQGRWLLRAMLDVGKIHACIGCRSLHYINAAHSKHIILIHMHVCNDSVCMQ